MVVEATAENIARAAKILLEGGLVGIPTETVYGLAADARNAAAVRRIFELKGRPSQNPLIVHIEDIGRLGNIASLAGNHRLQRRIERIAPLWPGPLTVVLPKTSAVPDIVTAGGDTVAVRIPAHPVTQALLRAFGGPLAAPSANLSGLLSPTTAHHVHEQFRDALPMILDGGACQVGIESTVIALHEHTVRILRPGLIGREALEDLLAEPVTSRPERVPEPAGRSPLPSPGLLTAHYAPRTPLSLWLQGQPLPHGTSTGCVFLFRIPEDFSPDRVGAVRILAPSGTLEEAAERLYAVLHDLDNCNLDSIVVETPENTGIGEALLDRLSRAAKGSVRS